MQCSPATKIIFDTPDSISDVKACEGWWLSVLCLFPITPCHTFVTLTPGGVTSRHACLNHGDLSYSVYTVQYCHRQTLTLTSTATLCVVADTPTFVTPTAPSATVVTALVTPCNHTQPF
jgi:hypothetical protein